MATPVSDTLGLLRELNKNRASRRKTSSDQLMQMTKMSNEKDIKLMSTKIALADRKRTAAQANFDANKIELDNFNESISLVMGEKEMISNPLEMTTGSVDAAKDIKSVLALMTDESRILGKNISGQDNAIMLAKQKYGQYVGLSKFLKGEGVSDFDESGSINADDVTLENYFKSNNINMSNLDAGTMRVLESLDKTGYRDFGSYQKLDTAYKKELQASNVHANKKGDEKVQDFITMANAGSYGDFKNSEELYKINLGQEDSELYEERYNQRKFALSVGTRPSLVEASVKNILNQEGSSLKGTDAIQFLNETYTELQEKFAWDSFKYNKDLEGRRKKLLDKKNLSNEEIEDLQSIELKQSVLEDANGLSQKYIKILNAASDPSNPVPTEFINEIEEIYSEYLESEGTTKKETGELLRDFFGFNPESREDVEWIKDENTKSINDSLEAIGLDKMDEDDEEESVGENTKKNFVDSNIPQNNEEEGVQFYDNPVPHLSNMVTGYEGSAPVLTQDMSMDAAYAGRIAGQGIDDDAEIVEAKGFEMGQLLSTSTPEEYIANNPDVSPSIRAMLENTYPKEEVVESLDKIEEVVSDEEKEWNTYLDSSKGFIGLNDLMSPESELNMHSDSLDTMPLATIALGDRQFEGRVNWVSGDTWSKDGRAIGTMDSGLEAFPSYNDSGNILSEEVQDKDFIRRAIKFDGYKLEEKLNSGELLNESGEFDALKFIKHLNEVHRGDSIPLLDIFYNPINYDENGIFIMNDEHTTILNHIYDVMNEYKALQSPNTIMQHGINRTLDKFSGDADSAITAVTDGHITQETYDRAFPSD